jgi:hypothetical protein
MGVGEHCWRFTKHARCERKMLTIVHAGQNLQKYCP